MSASSSGSGASSTASSSYAALEAATGRATQALLARGWQVVTAESCTGGLVAQRLTEIGGSSAWFERGFVVYSNAAKVESLGVDPDTLRRHGAVSEATACALAEGALTRSRADIAVSVTGIAGPTGGTPDKPVGLVWFAVALRGADGGVPAVNATSRRFDGDRANVRAQAATYALACIADHASGPRDPIA